MDENKGALQSRTVWAAAVAVIAVAARMLGYDIGDQEGIINDGLALVASGLAMYFRVKAVKRIGAE